MFPTFPAKAESKLHVIAGRHEQFDCQDVLGTTNSASDRIVATLFDCSRGYRRRTGHSGHSFLRQVLALLAERRA